MNKERLKQRLVLEEGLRLKPYHDTVGKLTIGIGRNLHDRGITREEAMMLLENDISLVERELGANPIYRRLDEVRQTVLADMAFNIGYPRLLGFKKMWAALERGDFDEAANQMLDSKWAAQVGERAGDLARAMSEGKWED